jgi:tetratricopeptide (TPR) repeat protein
MDESERAVEVLERAVGLYRETGHKKGEAACLNSLGAALRYLLRSHEAEERLWEAAAIRKELNEPGGLISIHNNLGLVLMDQGHVAQAKKLFADNLVLDQERDDTWGAACSMLNLGVAHLAEDDADAARPLIGDAIQVFVDEGDADGAAEGLEACVGLATARERWATAVRLAAAADAFRQHIGLVASGGDRILITRWTSRCREQMTPVAFEQAWAEGAEMTLTQAVAYARGEVLRAAD